MKKIEQFARPGGTDLAGGGPAAVRAAAPGGGAPACVPSADADERRRIMNRSSGWLSLCAVMVLAACQSGHPPIHTVSRVDLERFMGDWYVIASIPTPFEKAVYNGVESYRLAPDGTVATTFTFNKGAFDGPLKTYRPRGFVRDTESNAVWDMQFFWPIRAEYRIIYLADDYSQAIIGRTKRDYLWIMARTPSIARSDYERLLAFVAEQGYDPARVRKVPQSNR
jgi:apolipoprotein D and lipocalin family protein